MKIYLIELVLRTLSCSLDKICTTVGRGLFGTSFYSNQFEEKKVIDRKFAQSRDNLIHLRYSLGRLSKIENRRSWYFIKLHYLDRESSLYDPFKVVTDDISVVLK